MDVKPSVVAQRYAATRPATAAKPEPGGNSAIANAANDFERTLKAGEQTALSAMAGGADAQSLVQALAQTQLAVETAATVRDKVVEAYQEILRMPV